MQLTAFCLSLSCLKVSPDRSQFFRYDSISLSCQNQSNSSGWRVKRNTSGGGVRPCSSGWGSASSDSTCIIRNTYPSDSGVYWCQSRDGETSNSVNITVNDRGLILESPALPVLVGAAVILRCRAETTSSNLTFNFYKDGRSISNNSTGEVIIQRVSKSDEGKYKCSISGGKESVSSWLSVKGEHGSEPGTTDTEEEEAEATNTNTKTAAALLSSTDSLNAHTCPVSAASSSISRLMCHVAVGTPYLLSTVLLGLIYRDRWRAAQTAAETGSDKNIVMEIIT